jgi:GNAT superfamily N-acetyltransferase
MTIQPAGTEIDYTVIYLEMSTAPTYPWPHLPANQPASLLKADAPPVWYFLSLYDAVGRDYAWEDIHKREHDEIAEWLSDDKMMLSTLMANGWPQGFFLLDARSADIVDLAYFGLVPEAVGKGLGGWLLQTAILTAWDLPDIEKLTVNTCTLDHPRALQTYQKYGFSAVRRETHNRTLTRDRDLSRIPK